MVGTTIVKKTTLEERMFTLVSRTSLAITMFFLTTLWTKVDSLDQAGKVRDKELARFMLEIEHLMTAIETKVARRDK